MLRMIGSQDVGTHETDADCGIAASLLFSLSRIEFLKRRSCEYVDNASAGRSSGSLSLQGHSFALLDETLAGGRNAVVMSDEACASMIGS